VLAHAVAEKGLVFPRLEAERAGSLPIPPAPGKVINFVDALVNQVAPADGRPHQLVTPADQGFQQIREVLEENHGREGWG
jgi:hypothetical protein